MATQVREEQTAMLAPTLLDRVTEAIKQGEEECTDIEEALCKAQNKYDAKIAKLNYHLETLRRVKAALIGE